MKTCPEHKTRHFVLGLIILEQILKQLQHFSENNNKCISSSGFYTEIFNGFDTNVKQQQQGLTIQHHMYDSSQKIDE